MKQFNKKLLQFFEDNYELGAIGLVGTNDMIGLAIREAQRGITENGKASLWSHCFILGEKRYNLRGPKNTLTQSPYIFESDIKADLRNPQFRNGAQENWIGKWCNKQVKKAAIIDFGLSETEKQYVLATALQLADEQILYPIQELIGTWLAIMTKRQSTTNPFDNPHAMFCSAFVRYCYKKAGKDFLGRNVSVSNTTPEEIAQAGINANKIVVFD